MLGSDCEMIEREIVEHLNESIVASGLQKVDMLRDIVRGRAEIRELQWCSLSAIFAGIVLRRCMQEQQKNRL